MPAVTRSIEEPPPIQESSIRTKLEKMVEIVKDKFDVKSRKNEVVYDKRHPLYLGDWERSKPKETTKFALDNLDEPHLKRKMTILKEHPEVKSLYGIEPSTKYISIAVALIHFAMCYIVHKVHQYLQPFWNDSLAVRLSFYTGVFLTALIVGGTIIHVQGSIIHEASHDLMYENPIMNRISLLIANSSICIPVSMSFRRYHLLHHAYQGIPERDPDLPLPFEAKLIRSGKLSKALWLLLYPVMYSFRALTFGYQAHKFIPGFAPFTALEAFNWIFTFCIDFFVYYTLGLHAFIYYALSFFLGFTIHPAAAHFIQEHYTFDDGQETYSYYGVLNRLFLNIGFHNEHHDFAKIPWSRLPKLKEIANNYYEPLASHNSWINVFWRFITDETVGPVSRVIRSQQDFDNGRKMIKRS